MNIKLLQQNKKSAVVGLIAILVVISMLIQSNKTNSPTSNVSVRMNKHNQQVVQFFTKVIGSQKKTKVYIPFSFEKNPFTLILGYQTKDQTMNEFLIYHPEISVLDWPNMQENGLTLFQKVVKYQSIADFLENPSGKIITEENLKRSFPQLNAQPLEDQNDLSTVDYILSTQVPLKAVGNTYYYDNLLNTEDALLDESGQITWVIRAPKADEDHVFFLGNIDITYLQ